MGTTSQQNGSRPVDGPGGSGNEAVLAWVYDTHR